MTIQFNQLTIIRIYECLLAVNRAPPPAPAAQASGGGGMLSGIGSTIAQGKYVCLKSFYVFFITPLLTCYF